MNDLKAMRHKGALAALALPKSQVHGAICAGQWNVKGCLYTVVLS